MSVSFTPWGYFSASSLSTKTKSSASSDPPGFTGLESSGAVSFFGTSFSSSTEGVGSGETGSVGLGLLGLASAAPSVASSSLVVSVVSEVSEASASLVVSSVSFGGGK